MLDVKAWCRSLPCCEERFNKAANWSVARIDFGHWNTSITSLIPAWGHECAIEEYQLRINKSV
jgi:hypothetical protein